MKKLEFNWKEFMNQDNDIAVHCKTEEEAKDFCRKMHEHGLKWCDGDSCLEITRWKTYEEDTVYYSKGTYGRKTKAKENNRKIIKWENYMTEEKKEFPKTDLKDGMVVETRNGSLYEVLGDKMLNADGWTNLDSYRDNLKRPTGIEFDIVSVYKVDLSKVCKIADIFKKENLILIWQREDEVIEVTMEDIEKMHEKKVKIVKGE